MHILSENGQRHRPTCRSLSQISKPLPWFPTKTPLNRVHDDFVFPIQVPGSDIDSVKKYCNNFQRPRLHLPDALFPISSSVRQQNSSVLCNLKNTVDKELLTKSINPRPSDRRLIQKKRKRRIKLFQNSYWPTERSKFHDTGEQDKSTIKSHERGVLTVGGFLFVHDFRL
ncbi:unnamed protein product [Hymenolepis diminuta]|uniref:Uncharacterized protein n=1 Tax=Hymenolepis diminuta TaxID=6216 RepID=A0A564YV05_HYMDI|nr:unnamed protein product [Hymenolepis diminuta]